MTFVIHLHTDMKTYVLKYIYFLWLIFVAPFKVPVTNSENIL